MEESLIGNRYCPLEMIGEGGEACVFRARDESSGQLVALRLPRELTDWPASASSLPSFHPGWVRLLDSGTDSQRGLFQVFELLEASTLAQIVPAKGLDREAWHLFVQQSMDAVAALHEAGFVHGDLHADNFLFIAADQQWKLLELPFLRFAAPDDRSALFGSIYTMAPEQIDGKTASIASDIYALGCLYYNAACGSYPQTGNSASEIAIERLRFSAPPLTGQAHPLLPNETDWVMALLERKAASRPPSLAAARHLLKLHN